MRYGQLFIPTVKEVPAEAEIISHQLMIRAALVRKVSSGTYTYLPLGWRSLKKIIEIVRQEMDAAGAQEILMPILQPLELWQATGRDVDYGPTMCRFEDRHGRWNVLAPTAEEVVTSLVAGEVRSYKQLPVNLYQIHDKFRDEFRPRFGPVRSREFLMKDGYSFDADLAGLEKTYQAMYDAYRRIFDRCGLKYVVVEAESGPIGGSASHEFMVPCQAGEDIIVHSEDFSYAANIEKAEVDPPEQGTGNGERGTGNGVPSMEDVHTPGTGTIEAVCELLGTKPSEMIKTLVFSTYPDAASAKEHGKYQATHHGQIRPSGARLLGTVVALVRGDHEVNLPKLRRIGDAPSLDLASDGEILRVTRAKTGFAGPVGLVPPFSLVVDPSVAAMPFGVAGANRTDYHTRNVVPGRDFPLAGENVLVADIRNAVEGDTHGGKPLKFSRGVEVGHVFKLGTKYSEVLGAKFLDEAGNEQPCIMGCYGIGINRILAAAIEADAGHDASGCILPVSIAPFEVEVLSLNMDKPAVTEAAERIYRELQSAGADVLLDDRDARPGVKFKDSDLIGIPLRVVVGERNLKEGKVEIKCRTDEKAAIVAASEAGAEALRVLREMKHALAPRV